MAHGTAATQWDPYKLSGVTVTDRELGRGSYATVFELEFMGLKCAGKKIHDVLIRKEEKTYTVRRFEGECRLLSQIRHPNIVQFLGVYVCEQLELPMLVLEYLPATLSSSIAKYGALPQEISYSVLYDVALGLRYLHSQTPPIIHRDLSSNNVLLTHGMTAKISDLGVARILNMSPLYTRQMTQTPGTPAFMPPEVMIANPKYNTGVDEFSYGITMIHVLSGAWPDPQIGPTHKERGKLIPISEAKRREVFLKIIGNDHPLMDLILKCVDNDPGQRMSAQAITDRLGKLFLEHPPYFRNQMQMQKYIKSCEEDRQALKQVGEGRATLIRRKAEEIRKMKEERNEQLDSVINEKERLKMVHTLEENELQLEIERLREKLRAVEIKYEAVAEENTTLEKKLEGKFEEDNENDKNALHSFENSLHQITAEFQASLGKERERLQRLSEEKERIEKEMQKLQASTVKEIQKLSDEITQLKVKAIRASAACEGLKSIKLRLEEQVATKDAIIERYSVEIEQGNRLQRQAFHSRVHEQLTAAREFLAARKQPMQVRLSWQKCADLPFATAAGQSTVINGRVYFGGGLTDDDKSRYLIQCYSPREDEWTTLPPLPVKWFGLGQFRGKLAAVGGVKTDEKVRAKVYMYTFDSQKWRSALPPMMTARTFPAVTSLSEVLIVAGGNTAEGENTNLVEVFQQATSQWQMATSLPVPCCNISLVSTGDRLFALGGYDQPSKLNQVLETSISKLVKDDGHEEPTWRMLQVSPSYQPAAAMLSGNLTAIGGWKESQGEITMKSVHVYSSATDSWVYFNDLPEVCAWSSCAVFSTTEILVIGGINHNKVKNVYKGTLTVSA